MNCGRRYLNTMFRQVFKWFELLLLVFGFIAAVPSHNQARNKNVIKGAETTEIQVAKLRHMWTINDFHFDDYVVGQKLSSPVFSEKISNCQWQLFFLPKGRNETSGNYAALFFNPGSCNVNANVQFGFTNDDNERIYNKKFSQYFTGNQFYGLSKYVKQDILVNENNGIIVNNSLLIYFEVVIISTSQQINEKFNQLPVKDGLGMDLTFLCNNKLFNDVIIQSGKKEFPAHKNILAARSPFFKTVFEQDTKSEIKISRIDVSDMSDDVVEEMLRYIYTSKVSNLKSLAPNLLAAAEKYQLVGLKTICENYMSANLTVENAIDFYTIGDMNSAAFLKSRAKDFVVAHIAHIIPTSGFKSAFKINPLVIEEILSTKS